MEEHNSETKFSYKTDVTKHLLDNPEHTIDFEPPEILTSAPSINELLIKQTIFFNSIGQILLMNIFCFSMRLITDFYCLLFCYTSFFLFFIIVFILIFTYIFILIFLLSF